MPKDSKRRVIGNLPRPPKPVMRFLKAPSQPTEFQKFRAEMEKQMADAMGIPPHLWPKL